jgi:hypothetical protein
MTRERFWALVMRRAHHTGLKWFATKRMFLAAARRAGRSLR